MQPEPAAIFRDRDQAGHRLAQHMAAYRNRPDALVLALPRGGVPVGFALASDLKLPLDVLLVRKLGVPWQPELAMGAVASGGIQILNREVVNSLRVSEAEIAEVKAREQQILAAREHLFRGDWPPLSVTGRTIIVVDDGLATGSTMRAAVGTLRAQDPARLVIAVPVSSATTCSELAAEVDEMICLATPEPFWAVGQWYVDFSPTTDQEVQELLREAKRQEQLWAA